MLDRLTHEDDQNLSRLLEATKASVTGDAADALAEWLDDPATSDPSELSPEELSLLVVYAKLGRNMWLRHQSHELFGE